MGGKLSSQLSSLFFMCKEMHNTRLSLFGDSVFHTRYKDNIYVCGPPGSVFPFIQEWCDSRSELYTMPVQVEGFGYQMDVLESTIYVTGNGLSMQVRCKTLDQATRNSKPFRRWPDPRSLNCKSVMTSLIPGCASKCPLWALSPSDVAANVRSVCWELGFKTIRNVIPKFWHGLHRHGVIVAIQDLHSAWQVGCTWHRHIAHDVTEMYEPLKHHATFQ